MNGSPAVSTREFWVWAIEHCEGRVPILARWWPAIKRNTWSNHKVTALAEFRDLPWPELSRARIDYSQFPDTPPQGWPQASPGGGSTGEESTEILSDGSCRSQRFLEMTEAQSKDPAYLLVAHGFDAIAWELVSAKNKIWHGFSKDDAGNPQRTVLFASHITAKPKVTASSIDDILPAIRAVVTPVKVARPKAGKRLLELSFTDMHFGNSTLKHYRPTLAASLEHIRARKWKRIVLWMGSDFFHCDNFKNTTANGTPQSSVWWPEAVKDGLGFIGTVIEACLEQCVELYVYYVPGNHDESMAWLFTLLLQERYPQARFDTAIVERKVHVFGRCAIGMTHGDEKTRKDLDRVFMAEFPEFASASFREVHMGHLHHEKSVDNFGVRTRSLPTAARTDKWHRETGFVGANKVFQLFEWDADVGIRDVHYV